MTIHEDLLRLKPALPVGTILFFIVGDFHETYGDDVVTVAPLLNLQRTRRNGVPMCGFPNHAADSYLRRLLHCGKTVAVAARDGDSREIARTLSPPAAMPNEPSATQLLINCGLAALASLKGFIGNGQRRILEVNVRYSEEREGFVEILERIAATIAAMPEIYGTDGQGDEAIAHLHYFTPGHDAWIIEKEETYPGEGPERFQSEAFGYSRFSHSPDEAECGYISLPEILAAGAELDLHFTPVSLAHIKSLHPSH